MAENLNHDWAQYVMSLIGGDTDTSTGTRIVMHVDFDYFYAQCEEVRDPSLRGRPLAVCVFSGRTEDSGVVSTANYAAREHGVRSGIPIRVAKSRLAGISDAAFLPVDMSYYSEVSEKAMSLIQSFAGRFEQVGIDECFIDVSELASSSEVAKTLASQIKVSIKKSLGLTCSIGVAPNKMLAKIASDFQKPDGLTVIEPESSQNFIANLSVDKISGIGPKTSKRLGELGVKTISELAGLDQFKLVEEFGRKTGTFIHNAARGIDEEPVADSGESNQIARIITLKNDASTSIEMSNELGELCQSVLEITTARKLAFKTVSVIIILNTLDQKSKSKTLRTPSNSLKPLHSTAIVLLNELMESDDPMRVRRLGVRLSDFQNTAGQNTMSQFMGDLNGLN
jgi:DNA polymerase IV (archaeal DinB-like DNA polymerase)